MAESMPYCYLRKDPIPQFKNAPLVAIQLVLIVKIESYV